MNVAAVRSFMTLISLTCLALVLSAGWIVWRFGAEGVFTSASFDLLWRIGAGGLAAAAIGALGTMIERWLDVRR
jgi:hypothetical protein